MFFYFMNDYTLDFNYKSSGAGSIGKNYLLDDYSKDSRIFVKVGKNCSIDEAIAISVNSLRKARLSKQQSNYEL